MDIILNIIAVSVLLVFGALLSGLETALTAVSRGKIQHLISKGDKRARIVRELRKDLGNLIGTLLMVNTVVNVLASSLTAGLFVQKMGENGVLYATFVMSVLIVIYAEVLPKIYAINYPEHMSITWAVAIKFIIYILLPVSRAVEKIAHFSLKVWGIKMHTESGHLDKEELRGAIDLHHGPESAINQERNMLKSILDLSQVDVEKVMVHRKNVVMIDITQPVEHVIDQVLRNSYTRYPLFKDNPENIVGVLHTKDLLRALTAHQGDIRHFDIMRVASKPWFIPESTHLLDQLQAFRARREHFALVVDEYGSLMGIVTLEDILEEIVGDIQDEHDTLLPGVKAKGEGIYAIEGTTPLRDLNREFDWGLTSHEAATLAGLIMEHAECIPDEGQTFNIQQLRITILHRKKNQIIDVLVDENFRHVDSGN